MRKLQREKDEKIAKAKSFGRRVGITAEPWGGLAWAFVIVEMKANNMEQSIHKIHSNPTMCQDCSKEIHAPSFTQVFPTNFTEEETQTLTG